MLPRKKAVAVIKSILLHKLTRATAFFLLAVALPAQQNNLAEESRQANSFMARGDYEKAIPLYKHLVQAVPGNAGLTLDLGLAQHMAGHSREAAPLFETVLKSQPRNIPALSSLASCRLELNQPALAIPLLQQLLTIDPSKRDTRGMLAGAFMGVERFADAAEQYRKLTASGEPDARPWFGLGRAYESLAAANFARLEKIAPESAYVLELIADSQATRGQFRSAFYFYRQAAAKKADLPGLHQGLAKVYEQTDHKDWAQQEVDREKNLPAADCSHHPRACDFAKGKYLEAAHPPLSTPEDLFWSIKTYNQLALSAFTQLGHLPESPEIHGLKATLLQQHRQYKESAAEWKLALNLDSGNKDLRSEWEAALFKAQDYQTLLPLLQADIPATPDSTELNYQLGDCLLELQQAEAAVPYLRKVLQRSPQFTAAHASLGLALMQLGRAQEAIPELEKSLQLDDTGQLHYQLSRAYQIAGQPDKSKATMEKYQAIQGRNQQQDETLSKEAQITAPL